MNKTQFKSLIFVFLFILYISFYTQSVPLSLAQDEPELISTTVIPKVQNPDDCHTVINKYELQVATDESTAFLSSNVLGCAFYTGRFSLMMLPYLIKYASNWLLGLIGLVSLFFVVIGGLMYSFGGVSSKKDQGKDFIKNAIFGMVIATLAWSAVSALLFALTSI